MRLLNQSKKEDYLDEEIEVALTRKELLIIFEVLGNTPGTDCQKFMTQNFPFTYNTNFSALELSDILSDLYDSILPIMRSELSEIIEKEADE